MGIYGNLPQCCFVIKLKLCIDCLPIKFSVVTSGHCTHTHTHTFIWFEEVAGSSLPPPSSSLLLPLSMTLSSSSSSLSPRRPHQYTIWAFVLSTSLWCCPLLTFYLTKKNVPSFNSIRYNIVSEPYLAEHTKNLFAFRTNFSIVNKFSVFSRKSIQWNFIIYNGIALHFRSFPIVCISICIILLLWLHAMCELNLYSNGTG